MPKNEKDEEEFEEIDEQQIPEGMVKVEPEEEEDEDEEGETIEVIEDFDSQFNGVGFALYLYEGTVIDEETGKETPDDFVTLRIDNTTVEVPLPDFIELAANIQAALQLLVEHYNKKKEMWADAKKRSQ